MAFSKVGILGVGLMGGSVGLACRSLLSGFFVSGYSNNSDELARAVERGAIHQGFDDPVETVADCDLVILCTPVGLFQQMLASIAPALKPGAIVTDVGSTKRSVVALANELLPRPVRFVGAHPMVGGEKHGIDHARANLFAGGLCVLTPTPDTDPATLQKVDDFWHDLKMRSVRMTPQLHDQLVADISHLPHAIAAALVNVQSPASLELAGRGFLDTTRIAASDPALWRDILLENRDNLRASLMRVSSEIHELVKKLDADDAAGVQQWLSDASEARKKIQ